MHREPRKTLGRQTGPLVPALHDELRPVFAHVDVQALTRLAPASARSLVARLVRRGAAARLCPGRFVLVPYEAGAVRTHLDNPYLAAWELAGSSAAMLSHGSAMDLHGMRDPDPTVLTTLTPRRVRERSFAGTRFRYLIRSPERLFGATRVTREALLGAGVEHHLDTLPLWVADLERTVLDGLAAPHLVGGLEALARGIGRRRTELDRDRLLAYGVRFGGQALLRRLGFVLEHWLDAPPSLLARVAAVCRGATTASLDAGRPRRGRRVGRWRLHVDADARQLEAWRALAHGEPPPTTPEPSRTDAPGAGGASTLVLQAIQSGARTADEVALAVPLPLSAVTEALGALELAGAIRSSWVGIELLGPPG